MPKCLVLGDQPDVDLVIQILRKRMDRTWAFISTPDADDADMILRIGEGEDHPEIPTIHWDFDSLISSLESSTQESEDEEPKENIPSKNLYAYLVLIFSLIVFCGRIATL